jgi:hypothetical protein
MKAGQAMIWIIKGDETGILTPEMGPYLEKAGRLLAEASGAERVQARGRQTPDGLAEDIPGDQFRIPGLPMTVR